MVDLGREQATGPAATSAEGRGVKLALIGVAVAVVAASLFGLGHWLGSDVIRFAGLMTGATTFVPLPADTFVLAASEYLSPVTIGLVGGGINAVMVLVERRWLLILVDHPSFDRIVTFFDTNRVVAWTNRNLFLGLIIGGASFIPFEPFRLVAVMRGYSPIRYFVATFIARGGRYFVLAAAGDALLQIGVLRQALWVSLILFAIGLWQTGVRLLRA